VTVYLDASVVVALITKDIFSHRAWGSDRLAVTVPN